MPNKTKPDTKEEIERLKETFFKKFTVKDKTFAYGRIGVFDDINFDLMDIWEWIEKQLKAKATALEKQGEYDYRQGFQRGYRKACEHASHPYDAQKRLIAEDASVKDYLTPQKDEK